MANRTMRPALADVDLRLLRIFSVVVEKGGFSPAAAELNISDSTLSTHMRELEQRLGMRLCERGRSGFRLTEKGEGVASAMRELFTSLEQFSGSIAVTRGGLHGRLAVGVADGLLDHPDAPVQSAVAAYFQRPGNEVALEVRAAPPRDLERDVLSGRVAVALGPIHRPIAGLTQSPFFTETNYLYAGRTHPLFEVDETLLSPEAITVHRLIGRGYYEGFDEALFGPIRHAATVFELESAAALVLSGQFLGFLPEHFAARWEQRGLMRRLSPSSLLLKVRFGALVRNRSELSVAAAAFLTDLRSVFRQAKAQNKQT